MNDNNDFVRKEIKEFLPFAEKYLRIKNKDGEIARLKFNKPQMIVLKAINQQALAKKPIRIIVLKARQKGISTLTEAFMFWRTSFSPNRKAAIVAHEMSATNNLYEMTMRYHKNLPDVFKPELSKKNQKGLIYGDLQSEILCYSAETGDVGSSHTIQDLHLSEVAKWRDAKTTLTSLLQTVPNKPNTMVIMESTANGLGGEFYNRWQQAMEGRSNYAPVFLSWLVDDEYTLPFENKDEEDYFIKTIDQKEQNLLLLGASYEHLNWRRRIGIPDLAGNDEADFAQEYPATPEEAFIGSGRPFFNLQDCQTRFYQMKSVVAKKGDLFYTNDNKKAVEFRENPRGFISLYSEIDPDKGEYSRYAAGSDVAEGLAQGDFSSVFVLDRKTNRIALAWHGHTHPSNLGEEWHKIQLYCGGQQNFTLCPEHNNHGGTAISIAFDLGVSMYYRQSYEKGYATQKEDIGFKTSSSTKMRILNMLDDVIRRGEISIPDKDFWAETLTFVRNDKGTPSAEGKDRDPATKNYDDRVMAMALTIECHNWLPPYRGIKQPEIYSRVVTSSFGKIKGKARF